MGQRCVHYTEQDTCTVRSQPVNQCSRCTLCVIHLASTIKNILFKHTSSIKVLDLWFSNFSWSITWLQSLRIVKLGQVECLRWPLLLKTAKITKSTSSPESLPVSTYWNIRETVVLKILKTKKFIAVYFHSNLLPVYKCNVDQISNIQGYLV